MLVVPLNHATDDHVRLGVDRRSSALSFAGLSRAGDAFMAAGPQGVLFATFLVGIALCRNIFARSALALFKRVRIGGHAVILRLTVFEDQSFSIKIRSRNAMRLNSVSAEKETSNDQIIARQTC